MSDEGQAYLLDTNVFNDACDGKISLEAFVGRRVFTTGVQVSELSATANAARRAELIAKFEQIRPRPMPTASALWDVEGAGWDQACWNDGSGNFQRMLDRLRQLDHQSGKKSKATSLNKERDILIAETAIVEQAILVSGDNSLRQVVSEFGGNAIAIQQFVDCERN
jgi:predicted nucleic acid-binding protein